VPSPADGQAYNRYTYVNNNPFKYVDPTGHSFTSSFVGSVVGTIVGVAVGAAVFMATGGKGVRSKVWFDCAHHWSVRREGNVSYLSHIKQKYQLGYWAGGAAARQRLGSKATNSGRAHLL
jgi:hypothetical protein